MSVIEIDNSGVTSSEKSTAIYFTSLKKNSAIYYKDKGKSDKLLQVFGYDRYEDIKRWQEVAVKSGEKFSERIKLTTNEFSSDVNSALVDKEFKDTKSEDDNILRVIDFKWEIIANNNFRIMKDGDNEPNLSLFVYELMKILISGKFEKLFKYIGEISNKTSITCISPLTLMFIHSYINGKYSDTEHYYYYGGLQNDFKEYTDNLSQIIKEEAKKVFNKFLTSNEWRNISETLKKLKAREHLHLKIKTIKDLLP